MTGTLVKLRSREIREGKGRCNKGTIPSAYAQRKQRRLGKCDSVACGFERISMDSL